MLVCHVIYHKSSAGSSGAAKEYTLISLQNFHNDVVDCATRPHDTENTGITEDSSVNFDNTPFIILSVGTDAWAELSHYTGTCSDEEREPV